MALYVYTGDDGREYPSLPLGGPAVHGQTYELDSEPTDGLWATPGAKAGKAAAAQYAKANPEPTAPTTEPTEES